MLAHSHLVVTRHRRCTYYSGLRLARAKPPLGGVPPTLGHHWATVCGIATAPARVVFPAADIPKGAESEALAQQQAVGAEQQHGLGHFDAAHDHHAHLGLHLRGQDERGEGG